MRPALRVLGFVVLTILALSIKIYEKPIFSHIYSVIHPATDLAQQTTEDLAVFTAQKTKEFSKKLFDNSVPRFKDKVQSKMSSIKKTPESYESSPEEDVMIEEKEELDDLIKDHR